MRHWKHEWTFPIQEYWDPVSCPRCDEPAYRVSWARGELWFDKLESPWTKHACMPDDGNAAWARTSLLKQSYRAPIVMFGVVVYVNRDGTIRANCTDRGLFEVKLELTEKNPGHLAGKLIVFGRSGENYGPLYWFI